jgi:hypothetical protein
LNGKYKCKVLKILGIIYSGGFFSLLVKERGTGIGDIPVKEEIV